MAIYTVFIFEIVKTVGDYVIFKEEYQFFNIFILSDLFLVFIYIVKNIVIYVYLVPTYLLNIFYVPGTLLKAIVMNKADIIFLFMEQFSGKCGY